MRTAEECRIKAAAMDNRALTAQDATTRADYAEMAAQWRFVAKMADWQDDPMNYTSTLG